MHDIRWIRDNPDAFDRGADAARAARRCRPKLHRARRARRAAITASSSRRRRGATRPRRRSARPRSEEGRGAAPDADGRGRRAEDRRCRRMEAEAEGGRATSSDTMLAQIPEPAARRRAGRRGRARQCRASPLRREARLRLHAEAAFRARRSARPDGFRDRGETVRRALRRAEEGPGAAGARARPVHARRAHGRARLHRGQSAAAGARRGDVRHRAAAEVCARISSAPSDGFLADPHRRSLADQSRPRVHRRRRRSCRCASPPARRASAPKRARPARTRAA